MQFEKEFICTKTNDLGLADWKALNRHHHRIIHCIAHGRSYLLTRRHHHHLGVVILRWHALRRHHTWSYHHTLWWHHTLRWHHALRRHHHLRNGTCRHILGWKTLHHWLPSKLLSWIHHLLRRIDWITLRRLFRGECWRRLLLRCLLL